MTANVIMAWGGILTVVCNFVLAIVSLVVSRSNGKKLDVNTVATFDAKQAAALAVAAASRAATEAREVGVNNATAISGVAETLEAVRVQSNGNTEKLIAAALAQGRTEGHAAGVAAEQARVSASTGTVRALEGA